MTLGYVVLYMEDTVKAKDFWLNQVGFVLKKETLIKGQMVYQVGPSSGGPNLELVPLKLMEDNPYNLNLKTPSLAFITNNLTEEKARLANNYVKTTEIIQHENMNTFAFFDTEDNSFAMLENNYLN
ncbi:MAG: VOC family protein [Mycoplasmatales bacterium]